MLKQPCLTHKNTGFISTRLAGTDGVSMETNKWVDVFQQRNINCFFMAGELDSPVEKSLLAVEAHFNHPEIKAINKLCFNGDKKRSRETTRQIYKLKERLKDKIYQFIEEFNIDLLVPQNCLAIPMNIPLGLALTEVISETTIPTIAHHHDFFWERQRFLSNSAWEFLNMAFPPHLPSIHHVVINSSADNQLSLRSGISATIIPNVMDFDNPPNPTDEYTRDVREEFGIADDELLILQPTRVVQRKGIEHAIEFVSRLERKAKLVISHASGDEGHEYEQRIVEYSKLMKVDTIFISDRIQEYRGMTADDKKIYTLNDIYPHADLITYPSTFEGFGNAFLEAIYYKKPILVNTYSIYTIDIKPKQFKVIEMDGYVTSHAIKYANEILGNTQMRNEIVNYNYELAKRYYSYTILRKKLNILLNEC